MRHWQCPKFRFDFVRQQGALLLTLCTLNFCYASSQYVVLINSSKNVCTPPEIVHPAAEMCTPGAGCILYFGHSLAFLKIHMRHAPPPQHPLSNTGMRLPVTVG